jgi:uncharacterized protein YecT (DUF1311 family)
MSFGKMRFPALIALVGTLATASCVAQTQAVLTQRAATPLQAVQKELADMISAYRLRLNPTQRDGFDRSQEKWLEYRDAACQYQSSGALGGSAFPMVLGGCVESKTRQRLLEVKALSTCTEGDLSCPVWR